MKILSVLVRTLVRRGKAPPGSLGCFGDDRSDRVLTAKWSSSQMTPQASIVAQGLLSIEVETFGVGLFGQFPATPKTLTGSVTKERERLPSWCFCQARTLKGLVPIIFVRFSRCVSCVSPGARSALATAGGNHRATSTTPRSMAERCVRSTKGCLCRNTS